MWRDAVRRLRRLVVREDGAAGGSRTGSRGAGSSVEKSSPAVEQSSEGGGNGRHAPLSFAVEGAEELIRSSTLNRVSAILAVAAMERDGAEVEWITNRIGVLRARGRRYLINGAVNHETAVAARVVDDKHLTKAFLEASGAATPAGQVVDGPEEAVRFAETTGSPIVVKPVVGYGGKGVTVDVREPEEIRAAFTRARRLTGRVMVEEHLDIGDEYRCLVTPEACHAVVKRVLPSVVGDGRRTVAELIDEKNLLRRRNPMLERIPIRKDAVVDAVLARQALVRQDVPAAGRQVLVRNVGGLSGGGEPHEVSGEDPELEATAVAAAAAIPGLFWGGADLVVDRRTGRPQVLEMNINAGYGGAMFPMEGEPKNVAGAVWEMRRDQGSADDRLVEEPLPEIHPEPIGVARQLVECGVVGARRTRVGEAVEAVLRGDGWQFADWNGLNHGRAPDGGSIWLLRSGLTTQDLLAPRQAMRRHQVVRRLFELEGVPQTRGRLITRARGVRRHVSETGPLVAVPRGLAWSSTAKQVVTPEQGEQLVAESRRPIHFQLQVPGLIVRMYAHRDQVLCGVTDPHTATELAQAGITGTGRAEAGLETAADAAVRAVRAIPELRWGVVEVRIRPLLPDDQDPRVVVEGMVTEAAFDARDVVIAGSIADFARWVGETGRHPAGAGPEVRDLAGAAAENGTGPGAEAETHGRTGWDG